jgi:nucleoside-diphosphate-sugar epimerase
VGVTGAGGLVGRHLVSALGDDLAPVEEADVVIHLAAQTIVSAAYEDPVSTFEANVALAWRTAVAAPRCVFASTDQVYGPRPPVPVSEDAPLAPEGPYATSKAAADMLLRTMPGCVVARLANVYGPGDRHETRLVPGVVGAVREGRRPVVRGDGSARRDLVYVDDVVSALLVLAERGEAGEAYNVGTGEPYSVIEVVEAVLRVAGSDLEPDVLGDAPPGEGGERALDSAKLRALGWAPQVSLDEGLRRVWLS